MPDTRLSTVLDGVSRRLRVQSWLWAIATGGAVFGVVLVVGLVLSSSRQSATTVAIAAGVVAALAMAAGGWSQGASAAASAIERAVPLDNLVVAAAELIEKPVPTSAEIRAEVLRQADARLASADLSQVAPLRHPIAIALSVWTGCAVLAFIQPAPTPSIQVHQYLGSTVSAIGIDNLTVRVVPPSYAGRAIESFENPVQVSVLAGSRISLEVRSAAAGVIAEAPGAPVLVLEKQRDRFVAEFPATLSIGLALRPQGNGVPGSRFISILVTPDMAPSVRVHAPGRDLALPAPRGVIAIEVEGADDLGLAALTLRYTRAAGAGESLTFTQGDVPLRVTRRDDRRWTATARWTLDSLGLADGDVLVYSAIARDRNPSGAPVQSEPYLIEIGRASVSAGAGFGLPADERKYAISQQMVIYRTEQLLAARATHGPDSWLEQNRMIAIEQRMVRAEVVFLGGGEVADEVEEAASSDELAEGRLQNAGRAEMLRAINFMSRAEAQLNDGQAAAALPIERDALRALERAFDRRRYFLRTLPDRSRIDASRRLTGVLTDARSWTKDRPQPPAGPALEAQRSVMRDLAASMAKGTADAALAARVAALDAGSAGLQSVAVRLATAATTGAYRAAVDTAMRDVAALAQAMLATPAEIHVPADPMAGRLADELRRTPKVAPR